MTDPVDPISGRRKTPDRRAASRREQAGAPPPERRNAVVLAGAPVKHDPVRPAPPKSDTATAAFAARSSKSSAFRPSFFSIKIRQDSC